MLGRESLKPGGLLVAADLFDAPVDYFNPWSQWWKGQGLSADEVKAAVERIKADFHPVPLGRFEEIFRDAGFGRTQTFFQVLGFRGVTAMREALR